MDFISEVLQEYITTHSDHEPEFLSQLNRETWARVLHPRMLSGAYQGRVLSMLSMMIQPSVVLEIGTFTGYSAMCWAEGLKPDGKVITIDINDELEEIATRYFKLTGTDQQIQLLTGDARTIIPSIEEQFDLVFIDADKENYGVYYNLVFDKVKPGGYIIADNVLWSGNVLKPTDEQDHDTRKISEFNQMISNDQRVNKVMLPVRDGLTVIRKK